MSVPGLRDWLLRAIWLLSGVALIGFVTPLFWAGLAEDAAFPVPTYMITGFTLPTAAYKQAAQELAVAEDYDPGARLARAEAETFAGTGGKTVIDILEKGLAQSPASARSWTILSEEEMQYDPKTSSSALDFALYLAPYDYWLAGRRTRDAAILWNNLTPRAKERALKQARLMWQDTRLRKQLKALLNDPAVIALMTRALAAEPDEIRRLNRWQVE